MAREKHPHIHLFDTSKAWQYLIIGTFPPNTAIREKMYIDYFYGNKGFLWKIIHDIYKEKGYDFFQGTPEQNVNEIKRWQHDYCVAISDTIVECRRRSPLSSNDSDLVDIIYNHSLKSYVLSHAGQIKKIIFTSSFGKNLAYENFKIIMGTELAAVSHILVTGLPSPSGASNITFFNSRDEATYGLTQDFFLYVKNHHPHLLKDFSERWKIKKTRQADKFVDIIVPSTPKGLVKEYKLWKYRQALPSRPCN